MGKVYRHSREIWDKKKCAKLVKRKTRDSYGTVDHLPGFLKQHFGLNVYNGGCMREGKHYAEGEYFPFPMVPEAYEIIHVPTWWYRLVEKGESE